MTAQPDHDEGTETDEMKDKEVTFSKLNKCLTQNFSIVRKFS